MHDHPHGTQIFKTPENRIIKYVISQELEGIEMLVKQCMKSNSTPLITTQ